jgi:hypothetical protein
VLENRQKLPIDAAIGHSCRFERSKSRLNPQFVCQTLRIRSATLTGIDPIF